MHREDAKSGEETLVDTREDPPSLSTLARTIAMSLLSAVGGWLLASATHFDLRTTILEPAVRISAASPVTAGECAYKLWTDRETREKVEVTSKASCDSFQLCESDPCLEGLPTSRTSPMVGTTLRLARVAEARFSAGLARRLVFWGCTTCPPEVYASAAGESAGWSSLEYQRQASLYKVALVLLAIMLAIVLAAFTPSIRNWIAARRSIGRLKPEERKAWQIERNNLLRRDAHDTAQDVRSEVVNWLDQPSLPELIAIARVLRQQAQSVVPGRFLVSEFQLESRRKEHAARGVRLSLVQWWLIRDVASIIERKK